jgi:hypothetical protein
MGLSTTDIDAIMRGAAPVIRSFVEKSVGPLKVEAEALRAENFELRRQVVELQQRTLEAERRPPAARRARC